MLFIGSTFSAAVAGRGKSQTVVGADMNADMEMDGRFCPPNPYGAPYC